VTPRTNEALYQHAQREYYFDGHLRKVRPYYFEYQIYAKKRWWGLALGEVFQEEFRDRPEEYYAAAIAEGLITVNGEACTLSQPLCNR
jgi:tRNA pseudouridine synthase 9